MILRKLRADDKERYIVLSREFYQGPGVVHAVSEENFHMTFDLALSGTSPYMDVLALSHSEEEDQMQGFMILAFTWSNEAGGLVCWLEELYIRKEFRGLGFGRWVLKELIKRYRDEVKRFRLEVTPDNENAAKLYESFGFKALNYRQYVLDHF